VLIVKLLTWCAVPSGNPLDSAKRFASFIDKSGRPSADLLANSPMRKDESVLLTDEKVLRILLRLAAQPSAD